MHVHPVGYRIMYAWGMDTHKTADAHCSVGGTEVLTYVGEGGCVAPANSGSFSCCMRSGGQL